MPHAVRQSPLNCSNMENVEASFSPMLYFENVASAIEIYQNAFDAEELRRRTNEDGSVHVAEMKIGNAIFHLHEEVPRTKELSPNTLGGTAVKLGLFVENPDEYRAKAMAAGAIPTSAVQNYDYGYRQGSLTDPFGHHWLVEKKIY